MATWTPSDKVRLKELVRERMNAGGTLWEACEQFEFETHGKHTAKASRLQWHLFLRWMSPGADPGTERSPVTAEATVNDTTIVSPEFDKAKEVEVTNTDRMYGEDEASSRLLNAVSQILDDRRQLRGDVVEHKKLLDLSQRKVETLETEHRDLELRLLEADAEIDTQRRRAVDGQYKLQQLQDAYNQLVEARRQEYERLQEQISSMQVAYDALGREHAMLRRDSSAQIERLENALRNAESRNAQLLAESENVRMENASLTRRITEFAQQISNVLGDKVQVESPTIAPVPIRSTVAKSSGAKETHGGAKNTDKEGRAQA